MYKKSPQGWLKHWDFILLDIFCLQLAFVVAYLVRQGLENPYSDQIYRTVAFVFMLCQIVVMFLGQSYQDILKRGYYIEFTKTAKHVLMVMLLSVLYLFATQQAVSYSRLTLFYTAFLYLCFDYVGRVWHKENVLKKNATKKKEKSMVVVVSLAEAKETIEKILSAPIQNFSINGIALIDDNPGVKEIAGIPVVGNMDTISEYLCHEWVDEVFVKISETEPYPQKLIDEIIIMGLTVHLSLGEMEKSLSGKNFIEKIGGYSVITSSINTASPKQLLYKRLMDIAGGIVGCLLTVILIVVIGPMIYIKSPGPIFFSQVRIGKNGKKFKIYKFRSMYMDAEERKAELMSQNKMEGLMFKMDYDPRIIGSEKKDKNGNPKGIGNFIRKTSLDEFPQFWNVLKGDMSLVGTRPPTVDEWEQYELHHRSRMSIKPGITGMWQASGRSDITDFEEVVKLDTEYIENWSIGLDCRILLKTVNLARSGYNEAKRTCEALTQSYRSVFGVNAVIARFARVFGADKKHDTKAMSQFMDKAVLGEDIILKSKGQQRYSYCYISLWIIRFMMQSKPDLTRWFLLSVRILRMNSKKSLVTELQVSAASIM